MNPVEAFEVEISHPPTLHDIPWGGACTVDWSLAGATTSHVVAKCHDDRKWKKDGCDDTHMFQPVHCHQPFKKMLLLWRVGGTAKIEMK